ncbi:hypothetical protein R3P38DRAFT_2756297 [Favolaschia claudopus]|uniref:Uncharacterized protein n=1 Tax=Favolaschia claudopus TaxID=2862362 RepID=A0AAW0ECD0_9AGAR
MILIDQNTLIRLSLRCRTAGSVTGWRGSWQGSDVGHEPRPEDFASRDISSDAELDSQSSALGEDDSSFFFTPPSAPPPSTFKKFKGHSNKYYINMTGGTGGTGGASGTGLGGDGGRGDGPMIKISRGIINYTVQRKEPEFERHLVFEESLVGAQLVRNGNVHRRVHRARIFKVESPMTVVVYEGPKTNLDKEWDEYILPHMRLRIRASVDLGSIHLGNCVSNVVKHVDGDMQEIAFIPRVYSMWTLRSMWWSVTVGDAAALDIHHMSNGWTRVFLSGIEFSGASFELELIADGEFKGHRLAWFYTSKLYLSSSRTFLSPDLTRCCFPSEEPYWSFDPSGNDHLAPSEASNFCLPQIELEFLVKHIFMNEGPSRRYSHILYKERIIYSTTGTASTTRRERSRDNESSEDDFAHPTPFFEDAESDDEQILYPRIGGAFAAEEEETVVL